MFCQLILRSITNLIIIYLHVVSHRNDILSSCLSHLFDCSSFGLKIKNLSANPHLQWC